MTATPNLSEPLGAGWVDHVTTKARFAVLRFQSVSGGGGYYTTDKINQPTQGIGLPYPWPFTTTYATLEKAQQAARDHANEHRGEIFVVFALQGAYVAASTPINEYPPRAVEELSNG